jgi:hypothetical protein
VRLRKRSRDARSSVDMPGGTEGDLELRDEAMALCFKEVMLLIKLKLRCDG